MSAEKRIPLHHLHEITNGFSVDSRIGKGGYGDVYKGVYNGREVAVKLLHVDTVQGIDDQQYLNEVGNLLRVKHPNIVQLLGYSYETTSELVEHKGKQDFSKHIYRVLCFEYLQGESLDKRLLEESFAPDWSTRYMIIKGICEGLDFLHRCEPPIFHLDLKPANILLDSFMVPKVADFGLSRVISQSHTQVTKQIKGTQAYMPPEFINGGNISHKNDVFSLGLVMIEIMTGSLGYSSYIEMDEVAQFKHKVLTNWSTVIEATSKYRSEEIHQVKTCIELAIRCVDSKKDNRPTVADILDTLNKTEIHMPKRQLADVPPCPIIGPNNTMANTLKEMAAELDSMRNKNWHSSYMPDNSSNVQQVPDIRETISDVEEELIIGRTKETQDIVATLSRSITPENKITILPIYGFGGIGKTTLAQIVFNDSQFAGYSRVWVYVSQNLDFNKIGNCIISQLSEESHLTNKQMINKKLRELFAGKKILIVLDDVWETNPHKLKDLKVMLKPSVGSMVTVIVTTREETIAREICHTVGPYKLEILTNKSCWKIIKQQTAFKDRLDKKQLKHIGKDIATKCGGVALAAQSLGYTLKRKSSGEWESVRDNYIWNLSTSEDPSSTDHEVLASLLLSYSRMPDWLKLCFSYCAVFPRGHNIVKYDLIHQWIALGFTQPCIIFDAMQLCEQYVTQLLGMSFLQYSKTSSSDRNQDKDATVFTMHDLVHDLAKEILSHQLNTGGNKCRYALLTDCSNSLQLSFPSNIWALHFRDCYEQELCGGAFSSAKCLRVLDLSECLIKKLPDCIGQLKQLRFLDAPDTHNFEIPSCITELSELNYLNLRGSDEISVLPESIGDMKGLMHLDLSGCYKIRELPISFSELKQLMHLDLSGCNMFLAEALGGCTKLQYLNLSVGGIMGRKRITGLPEVIGNLIKLRYLNLSGCVDQMGPWSRDWAEEIHMLLCSISTLSNLEHLDLSENERIYSIPESIGNLTKLHTLDLSGSCILRKLPDSIFKMVSLKVLIYWSQNFFESTLPQFNFVSLPDFEVRASNDKCSSNISLLQPTNPELLRIYKLENVKSAEEATSVKLIEKQQISNLTFQWTLGAERFVDDKAVLEKLVPPSSVKRLTIVGYRSQSIPDWFMDIRQYLPNLSKIYLCGFPKCNKLPSLGELPNLEELFLHRMEGLEEWNTTHYSGKEGSNELMFPKLEKLTIRQCAKLRIKPCLPRARCLRIEDCDNMLSSWGERSTHISDSYSYQTTELDVYGSEVPMHQWRLLYHLPALRTLTIDDCSDLSTSPDMTQHLSSIDLQCLKIMFLDEAELPNWLAKLTSLQVLTLFGCESMTSLPQWLGEVTSLKKIEVECCTELEEWFESKENKRFIADIGVTVTGFPCDSDEEDISNESSDDEDISNESSVLEEASDESNEEDIAETDEETTNSQHTATGSQRTNNQRQRPRDDGVSNPSSLPPTRIADLHPSPAAHDTMPSMPTAAPIDAPALSVVVISDDNADNMSIICIGDDDKLTVSATARPARPTPCIPLGLLMPSPRASSLVGDGAEVDVLPRPGDTLTNATYNADDEGPLLDTSSGSWASLQWTRKGKGKQNETDLLVDLMDVPVSKRSRRPLELWGQDEETALFSDAASMVAGASTSSRRTLSFDLNVVASASSPPVLSFDFNAAAGASSPPVSSLDLNSPWV